MELLEPGGLGKGPTEPDSSLQGTYEVTSQWLADAGMSGAQKRDLVNSDLEVEDAIGWHLCLGGGVS